MARKYKEVSRTTTNTVDATTGELLGHNVVRKNIPIKDRTQFYTTFAGLVMSFGKLDYTEAKVLTWCCLKMELNANSITMVKHHKVQLAADMKINARSVDNALTKLVQKGYMHRVATAVFMIDPDIAWKGHINEHAAQIEVYLKYTIEKP